MNKQKLESILKIGETIAVEFKRCGNGIENDTYTSVCSFLNRFGGDIFMGVLDDGTVIGVPKNAAEDMVKNFIKVISNPLMFTPTIYLVPEIIEYEGKVIIHVRIPASTEVHNFKKEVYDRIDDADVKVTATAQLATMYIRKQNIFTEKRIFPYVSIDDLRLDLLPRIRTMATNNIEGIHSWETMTDEELLKSAGLYGTDRVIGEKGYNLAAVMLLGKDDVIRDVNSAYETDALLRKTNVDRYDDREIVRTNLIESYDQLMNFARKHLPDKFFLEGIERKNLRNIITREIISNILIHREFTSAYTAKFVIEKDKAYTENASRSTGDGIMTQDSMEPNPKNPIIASFFRNIGWSDRLGSGIRNLFKYSKYYSGQEPEFIEGDIFRTVVPLSEEYSVDSQKEKNKEPMIKVGGKKSTVKISDKKSAIKISDKKSAIKISDKKSAITAERLQTILESMQKNIEYSTEEIAEKVMLKNARTRELLKALVEDNEVEVIGANKNRRYIKK